jgi:hypothetical protein
LTGQYAVAILRAAWAERVSQELVGRKKQLGSNSVVGLAVVASRNVAAVGKIGDSLLLRSSRW